jgi:hypothetical protein
VIGSAGCKAGSGVQQCGMVQVIAVRCFECGETLILREGVTFYTEIVDGKTFYYHVGCHRERQGLLRATVEPCQLDPYI